MSGFMFCGTARGVEEHTRDGESCQPCRDWVKAGRPVTTPETLGMPAQPKKRAEAECGTRAGYFRHRRKGEPACEPCLEAHNAYTAREVKPVKDVVREHGTVKGWNQHYYRKEPACQPCKDAKTEDTRKYKARKKAGNVRTLVKRVDVPLTEAQKAEGRERLRIAAAEVAEFEQGKLAS